MMSEFEKILVRKLERIWGVKSVVIEDQDTKVKIYLQLSILARKSKRIYLKIQTRVNKILHESPFVQHQSKNVLVIPH